MTEKNAAGSDSTENDDIIWGAPAIAREINRDKRSTYYLLEKGYLPARKNGRLWSASRRKLRAHLSGAVA
jgi:hypothetical protein